MSWSDALSSSAYSLSGTTSASAPPSKYSTIVALAPRPSSIWVRENEAVEFDTFSTTIGSATATPASTRITVVAGASAAFKTANVSLR